jgi:hypothetical protein
VSNQLSLVNFRACEAKSTRPNLSPQLFALPSTSASSDQLANLLSECGIIKWRNVICRAEQSD